MFMGPPPSSRSAHRQPVCVLSTTAPTENDSADRLFARPIEQTAWAASGNRLPVIHIQFPFAMPIPYRCSCCSFCSTLPPVNGLQHSASFFKAVVHGADAPQDFVRKGERKSKSLYLIVLLIPHGRV